MVLGRLVDMVAKYFLLLVLSVCLRADSRSFCQGSTFLINLQKSYESTFVESIVLLAFDRFLAVSSPMRSLKYRQPSFANSLCIGLWCFSVKVLFKKLLELVTSVKLIIYQYIILIYYKYIMVEKKARVSKLENFEFRLENFLLE